MLFHFNCIFIFNIFFSFTLFSCQPNIPLKFYLFQSKTAWSNSSIPIRVNLDTNLRLTFWLHWWNLLHDTVIAKTKPRPRSNIINGRKYFFKNTKKRIMSFTSLERSNTGIPFIEWSISNFISFKTICRRLICMHS